MTTFPRRVFLGAVWIVALMPATLQGSPASARVLYVRQSGNDDNNGLSPAAALRTIGRGAMLAARGDTVLVGPGTYQEGNIEPTVDGLVRFEADRRGTRVGDPPGDVVVDATDLASGFEFNGKLAIAVDGFVVYGAANGIYVKSGSNRAIVSNNVVCNNKDNGILVTDSPDAMIFNNLVYNNRDTGIHFANSVQGSPGAQVLNNTVYRNARRGIFFAGTNVGSPNGLVLNNIVVPAEAGQNAGIQVNTTSLSGYLSAGNVSANRFAPEAVKDVTDIQADPLLVDPEGADGMLGGSAYADDDFHLSQERAGQTVTSPAVDTGSDLSRRLGLSRASTRSDGKADRGLVDAGYHYNNFSAPPATPEQRLRFTKIWVSASNGDDANDGATRETAVRTLKRAFALAKPGHMIVIAGGIYDEGALNVPTSGKSGRPIVIKALNGAKINGRTGESGLLLHGVTHIVVDGLEISGAGDNGIDINFSQPPGGGADNIVLRRLRVTGNGRGIAVKSASGVRLVASVVDGNGPRGVQVENAAMRIDRCTIRDNGDTGVWAFAGSSVAIADTEIAGNERDGILVVESDVSVIGGAIRGSTDGGARFKSGSTGFLEGVDVLDNTDVGVQVISSVVSVSGGNIRESRIGLQAFVDPADPLPVDLVVEGTSVCDNGNPAAPAIDAREAAVTLTSIELCANAREGVRQVGGTLDVTGGEIRSNLREGISVTDAQRVAVKGVLVEGNRGNGIQVSSVETTMVEDCVLSNNTGDGLTVLDSLAPKIVNNLVYGNGSSGILISGEVFGSPDAVVTSNTVYDNRNRGLFVGGGELKPPSTNAVVTRNIFKNNSNAGIQVNVTSWIDYEGDFNLNFDGYGGDTPIGENDLVVDPLLVGPERGDFHLSQTAAGQTRSSPAVDAGGVSAAAVAMDTKTTRTDNVVDRGMVDLGYHYPR